MTRRLRVLIVEDLAADALLLVRALQREGYEVLSERVQDSSSMEAALTEREWDVIISDFSLPGFSARGALETMRKLHLDLPFIVVSGTVDEDTAIDTIRAGAHDFMSKGSFARLVPAIERELRDAKMRAEQERMAEQLRISERMASIGTLAAGVAHEINNPLMIVMGGVEVAIEEIDLSLQAAASSPARTGTDLASSLQEARAGLKDAREAAERVRLIVRDLKAFSRSEDETSGPVDVESAIEGSIRMADIELRRRAVLTRRYSGVPRAVGNEARLGQVFLNLIVNAAQAMPSTRPVEDNQIEISTSLSSDGRILVEVSDNGPGIPDAVKSRIFDPFYTTKPIGEGTGLGLSICHRIVGEFGGEIQMESDPIHGTCFRTYLSIAQGTHLPPAVEPPVARAQSKILVIDDELQIGNIIARMLSAECEVVVSPEPMKAVQRLLVGEEFDAILCDLMMPGMPGMEVYARLAEAGLLARTPIAFMSGGASTKEAREFLARVHAPLLDKPFGEEELRKVLSHLAG